MKTVNVYEVGDVVLVKSLCFDNDVGGTEIDFGEFGDGLPRPMRAKIDRKFYDYETGQRFVGHLVDEKDVAVLRERGATKWAPKVAAWNPAKVYFGDRDVAGAA